jgi:hypothetical protein
MTPHHHQSLCLFRLSATWECLRISMFLLTSTVLRCKVRYFITCWSVRPRLMLFSSWTGATGSWEEDWRGGTSSDRMHQEHIRSTCLSMVGVDLIAWLSPPSVSATASLFLPLLHTAQPHVKESGGYGPFTEGQHLTTMFGILPHGRFVYLHPLLIYSIIYLHQCGTMD